MHRHLTPAILALGLLSGAALAADAPGGAPAPAAPVTTEAMAPKHVAWGFNQPFGTYDRASLQRGFQVYKEVCSACHSLNLVAIRSLSQPGGPGFSEAEVKAIAAGYMVPAGPNDQGQTVDDKGQPLMRPATPADSFPPPFANEQAARVANNGALPPDLSLIVKAREGHEDYIYSILTGFNDKPPQGAKMSAGMMYNPYFPGRQIAMPPPLTDERVTYADGTKATIDREAKDVVVFLAWAGEPKMEERKQLGLAVILFLALFSGLLYLSYTRLWRGQH
jgi:ubiquinol-cytochrome c reductase cytochrome c1 subunit